MDDVERAYQQFCTEQFPLPSPDDVSSLEEEIGVDFPPDYRQYLLHYNGGMFSCPRISPPEESTPREHLSFMHGILESESIAQLGQRRDFMLWDDNDPPEILPIGRTTRNSFILLITHWEDNGVVVLKTFTDAFYLADSIWEFFSLLEENAF